MLGAVITAHAQPYGIGRAPTAAEIAAWNIDVSPDGHTLAYDAGAELVITGHDHGYQRFAPADVTGTPDAARGIREFVVGTGGAGLYGFPTNSTLLEIRDNTTYGVMRLDLAPDGYSWEFMPRTGPSAFTDSGTGACH